jgi:hypothetical protein
MKQKSGPDKAPAEQVMKDIRRQTRQHYSAEEKIPSCLRDCGREEHLRADPPAIMEAKLTFGPEHQFLIDHSNG